MSHADEIESSRDESLDESPPGGFQERVEGEQVELDSAGAGVVNAEHVRISQGGASKVTAGSVDVSQGGIGQVSAETVSVREGGIGAVKADRVEIQDGSAGLISAREVRITNGSALFVAGEVSGDAKVIVDWRGALVVAGVLFLLLRVLFGRRGGDPLEDALDGTIDDLLEDGAGEAS